MVQAGDYFRIKCPREHNSSVIYEAVVISGTGWVSAKVVYPKELVRKLAPEGIFRIDLNTLDIINLGKPEEGDLLSSLYA